MKLIDLNEKREADAAKVGAVLDDFFGPMIAAMFVEPEPKTPTLTLVGEHGAETTKPGQDGAQ